MEEQMRDLDKNDFRAVVHSMELERVRYIMASYLRCRLQKIETYTQHILNQEASRDLPINRPIMRHGPFNFFQILPTHAVSTNH